VRVVAIAVEEAKGKVPVLAGAGGYNTAEVIALGKELQQVGVDGLLSVNPYYNRPTQEGLYQHFKAIADAVPLPIVLYNIPGRCGVDLSLATLERLASVEQIVGIKESTGTVQRSSEIAKRFGERFTILSGDDVITLPIMAVGGHGVISVAANVVPKEVSALVDAFRAGDLAGARRQHQRLADLVDALFIEANPGPVKFAMAVRGVMSEEIRLPMVAPAEVSRKRIQHALAELGAT
jgi:4-hydroxy-tetrahydrodipicolinate synthase